MPRPASKHPTELELQILNILWKQGELRARDVRAGLADGGHDAAHTSVVTTLNTMARKRYLKRRKSGNAYLFSARVGKEDVSEGIVQDVVDRVFEGSAKALVLNLLGSDSISQEEQNELRALISDSKSKTTT